MLAKFCSILQLPQEKCSLRSPKTWPCSPMFAFTICCLHYLLVEKNQLTFWHVSQPDIRETKSIKISQNRVTASPKPLPLQLFISCLPRAYLKWTMSLDFLRQISPSFHLTFIQILAILTVLKMVSLIFISTHHLRLFSILPFIDLHCFQFCYILHWVSRIYED